LLQYLLIRFVFVVSKTDDSSANYFAWLHFATVCKNYKQYLSRMQILLLELLLTVTERRD
jgi:hypothetical protein